MSIVDALFDVLEGEAEFKYYLKKGDDWATLPAIIICYGPFAKLGSHSYTTYFGRGLANWTFKTSKEAQVKAFEVLSNAKIEKPFQVKVDHKGKSKILLLPFQINEERQP